MLLLITDPIPECICGCHQRLPIGTQIAHEMREALYKELELTSCAGVAHNKLLAKLVGGQHKPNNQTMIYPEYAQQMMISLGKVRAIPGKVLVLGAQNGSLWNPQYPDSFEMYTGYILKGVNRS